MNETIRKAINEALTLRFHYKGSQRCVEPHTYGLQHNDRESLCAWQFIGGSGEDFRLFFPDEMINIAIGPAFDGPRPQYHKGDQRFRFIYAEL